MEEQITKYVILSSVKYNYSEQKTDIPYDQLKIFNIFEDKFFKNVLK